MDNYKVCIHLINDEDKGHLRYFTGKGKEYYLICPVCAEHIDDLESCLLEVNLKNFKKVEEDIGSCEGIIGTPQILVRKTDLCFEHEIINLGNQLGANILDIADVSNAQNLAYALTDNQDIIIIDLLTGTIIKLFKLSQDTKIDFSKDISMHLSKDARFAAIVNTFGQYGVVIDLVEKTVSMNLDRGYYHVEHCKFPIAFFNNKLQQLMVHGTNWNRIDISNPKTGEMLTKRSFDEKENPKEYFLDYFHSAISISCDNKWIVDNGWAWSPVGQIVSWSLEDWVNQNPWESEIGKSKKVLCDRIYYWNGAICWIDSKTLGVYGFGEDDDWIIPAIRIFDVESGNEINWFPGPEGSLAFDMFLFSWSQKHGVEVWDVNSGERLLLEEHLCPHIYHRASKQFITILDSGNIKISRLKGDRSNI